MYSKSGRVWILAGDVESDVEALVVPGSGLPSAEADVPVGAVCVACCEQWCECLIRCECCCLGWLCGRCVVLNTGLCRDAWTLLQYSGARLRSHMAHAHIQQTGSRAAVMQGCELQQKWQRFELAAWHALPG